LSVLIIVCQMHTPLLDKWEQIKYKPPRSMTLQGQRIQAYPVASTGKTGAKLLGCIEEASPPFRLTACGAPARRVGRRRGGLNAGDVSGATPGQFRARAGAVYRGYADGAVGGSRLQGSLRPPGQIPRPPCRAPCKRKTCGRCLRALSGPGNRMFPGIVEMTEPRRSKACNTKPRPCTPSGVRGRGVRRGSLVSQSTGRRTDRARTDCIMQTVW